MSGAPPALPSVSVIVCAYTMRRWELLLRALDSVRAQGTPALELLLVVDHCTELLERASDVGPGVRVVANAGTRGLSGARNTGVAAARGDVVAFLDDDAAAAPDWLEHLLRPYADPAVVGVGGRVVAEWERSRPAWFPPEFDWVVGCSYAGLPAGAAVVRNPIGANMSFRRGAVGDVGGFSEAVGRIGTRPLGCEETELSIRMARRDPGRSIVLEPLAVVGHHVPHERARWSYFWRRCWAEGMSKAAVSGLADPRAALASERTYVRSTLTRGAGRGLAEAVRRHSPDPAARAGCIAAGLAVTALGYATGRAGALARPRQPEENTHGTHERSGLARLRRPRPGGGAGAPEVTGRPADADHAGELRGGPRGPRRPGRDRGLRGDGRRRGARGRARV